MLPNWLYGKSLRKLQEILNSGGQTAAGVSYSNTESGLEATNAQAAIDEVVTDLNTKAAQSALTTLSDTVTTLTGTVNGKVGWPDYAQLGAVNLLPITATTQTVNGITFTINNDGSITVTGTASATAILEINSEIPLDSSLSYKMSGCPSGGSEEGTYRLDAYEHASGQGWVAADYGIGGIITGHSSIVVRIRIANGYAITDSLTFYPMLTLASYTGSYVPYAKTNAELTSDVSNLESSCINYVMISGGISIFDMMSNLTAYPEHTIYIGYLRNITDGTNAIHSALSMSQWANLILHKESKDHMAIEVFGIGNFAAAYIGSASDTTVKFLVSASSGNTEVTITKTTT